MSSEIDHYLGKKAEEKKQKSNTEGVCVRSLQLSSSEPFFGLGLSSLSSLGGAGLSFMVCTG